MGKRVLAICGPADNNEFCEYKHRPSIFISLVKITDLQ
jgi:hypothetical protein